MLEELIKNKHIEKSGKNEQDSHVFIAEKLFYLCHEVTSFLTQKTAATQILHM